MISHGEKILIWKLIAAQKAQGNMKEVIYVPDAFDEGEAEVEQRIEMIEEQKEATDFRIEGEDVADNQIVEEKPNIIIFQPEEEKQPEEEIAEGKDLESEEGKEEDIEGGHLMKGHTTSTEPLNCSKEYSDSSDNLFLNDLRKNETF